MGHTLQTPLAQFSAEEINFLLYGNEDMQLSKDDIQERFEGIIQFMMRYKEDGDPVLLRWVEQFMHKTTCPSCQGYRLKQEALHFKISGKHIGEISAMDLSELDVWLQEIDGNLSKEQQVIASEILKEIKTRL